MTIKVEDNKIIFSRTIQAPIEKVFDAYTKKELFEKWFHPKGASTEVFHFNVITGGDAFYAIKTPALTSYTLVEYETVKRPYLIEYIDSFATSEGNKDTKMPSMKITLSFSETSKTETTVTSISTFPTKEAAQQVIEIGVEEGMNQTLDQLDALLK
ncbi:SRPBCC family protein [Staphylococcus schweitzeri]|uniref:SRPBCC family protein n=1 Tax=Staphylococcus schweitzeri TaxID=1654388 RepID=UPI000508C3C7|nr:SRPBCC domain-containing protein [Staphylococcus schweitzeri]CDR66862.1 activator of Hsp90 ATPase1-like protein [Staphylococcus schweitzeri]